MQGHGLSYRQLRRSWWTTPVLMTFWLLAIGYFFSINQRHPDYTPFWIALGLGVVGFLSGLGSNGNVRRHVAAAFGVSFVPETHRLAQRVHRLAAEIGLPPPDVGVMSAANALAVGTNARHSAVILGTPLLKILSDDELDAVIGHELGHIATNDMQRLQVAEGYQQFFGTLFSVMVVAIIQAVAKSRQGAQLGYAIGQLGRVTLMIGGELVVKSISRRREFYADAIGAALASPAAMQGALTKIHELAEAPSSDQSRYGHLMFRGYAGAMFSTHPSLQERLGALQTGGYLDRLRAGGLSQQAWEAAKPVAEKAGRDGLVLAKTLAKKGSAEALKAAQQTKMAGISALQEWREQRGRTAAEAYEHERHTPSPPPPESVSFAPAVAERLPQSPLVAPTIELRNLALPRRPGWSGVAFAALVTLAVICGVPIGFGTIVLAMDAWGGHP